MGCGGLVTLINELWFLLLSEDIYCIWFLLFLECQLIRSFTNYSSQQLVSFSFWEIHFPSHLLPVLVTHINLRLWLTNLTWIWQNTVCSLGLICNIFKIHINRMIWTFEKTVSSSFPEEHSIWGVDCVLGWKRKEFVVGIKQRRFQLRADIFFFFVIFLAALSNSSLEGPAVSLVFPVTETSASGGNQC